MHIKLTAFLLLEPLSAFAMDDNYCLDKSVDQEWGHLLLKYPNDIGLKNLVNLRSRLCTRVIKGEIPVDAATTQFESAREKLMEQWRNKNKQRMIPMGEVA
jgi:hypothetical protein